MYEQHRLNIVLLHNGMASVKFKFANYVLSFWFYTHYRMTERNGLLSCKMKLTGMKIGTNENFREHEDATSVFLKSGNFWQQSHSQFFKVYCQLCTFFSGWICDTGRNTMASVTCYLILNEHFIPMTHFGPCDSYADQSKHRLPEWGSHGRECEERCSLECDAMNNSSY
jgi:hypothetical protein